MEHSDEHVHRGLSCQFVVLVHARPMRTAGTPLVLNHENIVERFGGLDPMEIPAVLVRNHGPFAWGPSGAKAVENALALEIVADMAFHALTLDPSAKPPSLALSERHFLRKHGPTATYGQA